MNNNLQHHGILGMKWGVRRYQNPDGSYTDAGRKRRGYSERRLTREENISKIKNMSDDDLRKIVRRKQLESQFYNEVKKKNEVLGKTFKTTALAVDAYSSGRQLTGSDNKKLKYIKKIADSSSKLTNDFKIPKKKTNLSDMTDAELIRSIERMRLEKQAYSAYNIKTGEEYAFEILDTASAILGATGSALAIVLAIKQLKKA